MDAFFLFSSFCQSHEDKVRVCVIRCNFNIQLGVLIFFCVFILGATPVPSIPLNSVELFVSANSPQHTERKSLL